MRVCNVSAPLLGILVLAGPVLADPLTCGSFTAGPGYTTSGYITTASAIVNPYCGLSQSDSDVGAEAQASLSYLNLSSSASSIGFNYDLMAAITNGTGGQASDPSATTKEAFTISDNPNNLILPLTFTFALVDDVQLTTITGDQGSVADDGLEVLAILTTNKTGVQEQGTLSMESVAGGATTVTTGGALGPSLEAGQFSITADGSTDGTLQVILTNASEAPGADVWDEITLQLLSVTVAGANAGNGAVVNFADGTSFPITDTPEPAPAVLLIIGAGIFVGRRFYDAGGLIIDRWTRPDSNPKSS